MTKYFYLLIALLASSIVFGQNYFIQNQWYTQKPMLNPAASGISDKLDAAMGSRLGGFTNAFEGSLLYGRVDMQFTSINSGFGFSYFNNNPEYFFGADSNFVMRQRLALNYNYQITFNDLSKLAFGVVLDVERTAWQLDFIGVNPNDPSLPPQVGPGNDLNLGFGVFYQAKFWQAGISLTPTINLIDEVNINSPDPKLNIILSGRYPFADDLAIESDLLYSRAESTRSMISLNLKLWLADAYYAGVAITNQSDYPDSFDILLGISFLNRFRMHYVYSIGISDLTNINANRHILSLQYRIPQ